MDGDGSMQDGSNGARQNEQDVRIGSLEVRVAELAAARAEDRADLLQRVDRLERALSAARKEDRDSMQAQLARMWNILDELREQMQRRLPAWATLAMTALGSVAGAAATAAIRGGLMP